MDQDNGNNNVSEQQTTVPANNEFESPVSQTSENVTPSAETVSQNPVTGNDEFDSSLRRVSENVTPGSEVPPQIFSQPDSYTDTASQNPQNSQSSAQGTCYTYTPNGYGGQYGGGQQYYQNYYSNGTYPQQKPKKHKGLKITLSVVGAVAVFTGMCLLGYWAFGEIGTILGKNRTPGVTASQNQDDNKTNDDLNDLVVNSKPSGANEYTANSDGTLTSAAVISKVRPSIVGIVQYVNSGNGIPTINGQGSGIIISADGYILTNAHVVSDASIITVVLENGDEERATLKGLDTQSDLAIIKIEKNGLQPAELGSSSQTVVGESVIAIGNPGGLELAGSCTGGMVSGLNRTISSDSTGYAMSYIQTDAAINPGNSGGALVNMYGQVIGINSAKVAATGYEGLGFAIPIDEALPIVKDLQQYGYVKNRAKIGISFQLISQSVAQYYNFSIPAGLLVTQIDSECDISTKGVLVNDIITHIDGEQIESSSTVYSALQKKKPGDSVTLTVYRIGTRASSSKTFEVNVILAEDKGTTAESNNSTQK